MPLPQFPDTIYALVSITPRGDFQVSPDPIVVNDSQKQEVIWFAEDADVTLAIEFDNPKAPAGKKPPKNPDCSKPGRRCGGKLSPQDPSGFKDDKFKYTVKGKKGGTTVPDLDPDLIILK